MDTYIYITTAHAEAVVDVNRRVMQFNSKIKHNSFVITLYSPTALGRLGFGVVTSPNCARCINVLMPLSPVRYVVMHPLFRTVSRRIGRSRRSGGVGLIELKGVQRTRLVARRLLQCRQNGIGLSRFGSCGIVGL